MSNGQDLKGCFLEPKLQFFDMKNADYRPHGFHMALHVAPLRHVSCAFFQKATGILSGQTATLFVAKMAKPRFQAATG